MRVEMSGPSGVGKSTTLQALNLSAIDGGWVGPAEVGDRIKHLPPEQRQAIKRDALDQPDLRQFVNHYLKTVSRISWEPSRKIGALAELRETAIRYAVAQELSRTGHVLHDELFLNRYFSVVPHVRNIRRFTQRFVASMPKPDRAVICSAKLEDVLARVEGRSAARNVYFGAESELSHLVAAGLEGARLLEHFLSRAGVECIFLSIEGNATDNARRLESVLAEITA